MPDNQVVGEGPVSIGHRNVIFVILRHCREWAERLIRGGYELVSVLTMLWSRTDAKRDGAVVLYGLT